MCCGSTFVTVVLLVVVVVFVYDVVAAAAVFHVDTCPLPFEDWFWGVTSVRQ